MQKLKFHKKNNIQYKHLNINLSKQLDKNVKANDTRMMSQHSLEKNNNNKAQNRFRSLTYSSCLKR